ncbi:hypothetical protein K438DRAFT_1990405 [Mycena galopus ATCC 62051]|nr:hypothetical protein K438DRAFT_1990405 [Mycena galopus ATCC 62051]
MTRTTRVEPITCTASDPVVTVTVKKPALPTRGPRPNSRTPDLIFRFDLLDMDHDISPATQLHPALLFSGMEDRTVIGDLGLASLHWTPRRNLACTFLHNEQFNIAEARKRTRYIWTYLRSALGLPETCPEIIVDDGGSWYNVIIHSVPVPPPEVYNGVTMISDSTAITWLRSWGVTGAIQAASFLCSEDDLARRSNAPLRVTLSSQKDADLLVHKGALVLGSYSRVSRYVPNTKSKLCAAPP